MTLWQEQSQQERQGTQSPPRSRREARDAERRAIETGDVSNVHPSGVVDMNASGNIWDTLSRRAASQLTDAAEEAERRTGRRVSDTEHPSEPLSWIGQGRPQVPSYEGTRRPSAPTYTGTAARNFTDDDTHTRPSARVAFAPPALLAEDEQSDQSASLDHTMTRRQLRAMRETGAVPSLPEGQAWMPAWRPDPLDEIAPSTASSPAIELAGSAFSSYEDTATVQMSAVDRASMAADEPAMLLPEVDGPVDHVAPPTAPVSVIRPEVLRAAGAPNSPPPAFFQPLPTPQVTAAKPFADPEYADESLPGLQGFEALLAQRASGVIPSVPAPAAPAPEARVERPLTPPRGHWSQQAEEPDEDLPFAGMLTRNVASSAGSTNALIMSSDPQLDLLSAVNSTGEIFITGSLDLPRSLSSMGAPSEGYDSSEIDRLFEASQEREHQTAEVAPVRAARAVASHTSTRAMVSPRKRSGGALPMVLAVTAAVMAIGVAVLLIGGYVLRMF